MKLISSKVTFFQKRVFPVIWFGGLIVFVATALSDKNPQHPFPWPVLIMPVVMAVFGYFIFKKLIFDLADEVHDLGDRLVIKRGGRSVEVHLTNVINVSSSSGQSPARIMLTLREPCELGKEIAFMAPHRWNPFAPSPVAAELIERIDALRQRRH